MGGALPVLKPNERPDLCGPCGGRCCSNGPGIVDPADLGSDLEFTLRVALGCGQLAIAGTKLRKVGSGYVSEEVERLYVSPHTWYTQWDRPGILVHGRKVTTTEAGACGLLTPTGCSLPFVQRPAECRDLVATSRQTTDVFGNKGPACKTRRGHDHYVDLWAPHQALLKRLSGGS